MKIIEKIKKTFNDLNHFKYENITEYAFDNTFTFVTLFINLFFSLVAFSRFEIYKYNSEDFIAVVIPVFLTILFGTIFLSLFNKLLILSQRKKNNKDEQDE